MGAKEILFKVLIYFLFFFIGIEYVLVLPSLNGYLETLGIGSSYVGICIAAVNFSALLTATPMGRLADYLGSARVVGAFAAGFCVLGNLLYVMVPSIYFIVFSRICSGVGSGLEPILMGLLGRAYSPEERSAVFSQHMLAREMGLIFGPLLNLFYDKVDIVLACSMSCPGEESSLSFFDSTESSACLVDDLDESCQSFVIRLNKYTMPAAFLVISWTTLIVCLLIFYVEPSYEISSEIESIVLEKVVEIEVQNEDLKTGFEVTSHVPQDSHDNENGESKKLLKSNRFMNVTESARSVFDYNNPYKNITISNYSLNQKSPNNIVHQIEHIHQQSPLILNAKKEENLTSLITSVTSLSEVAELVVTQTGIKYPYLTEQFVVVMITSFAVMFFESAMEASLTPMTAYFFHWENYENSICYVCLGLCALTGYIIIMVLQNKIKLEDRTALLIGAIGVTIGQTLAFFALPQGYYGCPWILPVFAAVIGISVVSLPFLLVPPASMLSKIAPADKQATLQGVRMSFQKIAMVLGPLWGTSTLWNFYVVISAPVLMCILVTTLTSMSYYYLKDERLVPRQNIKAACTS